MIWLSWHKHNPLSNLINHIRGIGFMILPDTNSWELLQIFLWKNNINLIPLLGLLITAPGKLEQFGLLPWLPSAIDGPNPVSALLHSSTKYYSCWRDLLIIWFYPLISNNSTMLTPTLCFGSLTTLVTAICAFTKNDILKNVAFPTSSWLGLIIVTLGVNQPCLTFLHIVTWRSSKLCFSYAQDHVIHILNDEQDNLKLGSLLKRKTKPIYIISSNNWQPCFNWHTSPDRTVVKRPKH